MRKSAFTKAAIPEAQGQAALVRVLPERPSMSTRLLLPLMAALAVFPAAAHEYDVGVLHIGHPYARTTPPGATSGAAYFSVESKGAADKLLRATTPRAGAAELHSMSMDGNIMRMRAVPNLAVPAGGMVKLEPSGYHLMLTGLKQPLKAGDRFPLTLYFEKAGPVTVDILVQDATAATADAHAGHDHK